MQKTDGVAKWQKCGLACSKDVAAGGRCFSQVVVNARNVVTFWELEEAVLSAGQGSLRPKSAKVVFVSVLTHPSQTILYGS